MQTLLQISWRVRQWKNYENRPTSDELIVKIKRCAFFETQCSLDSVSLQFVNCYTGKSWIRIFASKYKHRRTFQPYTTTTFTLDVSSYVCMFVSKLSKQTISRTYLINRRPQPQTKIPPTTLLFTVSVAQLLKSWLSPVSSLKFRTVLSNFLNFIPCTIAFAESLHTMFAPHLVLSWSNGTFLHNIVIWAILTIYHKIKVVIIKSHCGFGSLAIICYYREKSHTSNSFLVYPTN